MYLAAEVVWQVHLTVSVQAEVHLNQRPTGGRKDEKAHHKLAHDHPSKDARAHAKRGSKAHGTGDRNRLRTGHANFELDMS